MDNYIDNHTFKIGLITAFLVGGMIGIYGSSLRGDTIQTVTKTTVETDTVFVQLIDTVHVTRTQIKHEQVRDTVYLSSTLPINNFSTTSNFLYGSVNVSGEVVGEVLSVNIIPNFKLPQVTNTITKETVHTKKPAGLFVTAGLSNRTPYVGAVFIKDRYLLGLSTSGVQVGYKLK